MRDFMAQRIVSEFVSGVTLDKQTSGGMNPTRPGFKLSDGLELMPVCRLFKYVDMRFRIISRSVALEFLGDDPIMKFRFH